MEYFYIISAALVGSVIGSFLNVAIYRMPRDMHSVNHPRRSFCPNCHVTIPWYLNIPVLSFIALRGRCRYCGSTISLRYPFVEALTAAMFVLAVTLCRDGTNVDWLRAAVIAVFGAAMIVITFIDIDFRIIPDEISKPGMLIGVLLSMIVPGLHEAEFLNAEYVIEQFGLPLTFAINSPRLMAPMLSIIGLLVGGGAILVIRAVASAIARREAMGLGDVKLMALVGAFVGWRGALIVIIAGALLGAVIAPAMRILARSKDPKIAFGPFLAVAAFVVILLKEKVIEFITVTYPDMLLRNPDRYTMVMLVVCVLMVIYLVIFRVLKNGGTTDETH